MDPAIPKSEGVRFGRGVVSNRRRRRCGARREDSREKDDRHHLVKQSATLDISDGPATASRAFFALVRAARESIARTRRDVASRLARPPAMPPTAFYTFHSPPPRLFGRCSLDLPRRRFRDAAPVSPRQRVDSRRRRRRARGDLERVPVPRRPRGGRTKTTTYFFASSTASSIFRVPINVVVVVARVEIVG